MILRILLLSGLILAAIPALLFLLNCFAYRIVRPRQSSKTLKSGVSVLIPARNEESNIAATLHSVLANTGVDFEVLVLDDHSTDRTGEIVSEMARQDARVGLVSAQPLPPGWCGKQFAAAQLARQARYSTLVFIDADVRLARDALIRLRWFMNESGAALASGVPFQELVSFSEKLLLPLIHFLLLGFLPMFWMRRTNHSAYGAGCGQLFVAQAAAYRKAGGHASIRYSLHDGLTLPRAFRKAGLRTDLFDATDLATCRMYRRNTEVWRGLGKNAVEGLASPAAIAPMSLLLAGGQVLPVFLLVYCLIQSAPGVGLAFVAVLLGWLPRVAAAHKFRQPYLFTFLHPLAVLALLGIQWWALGRYLAGFAPVWKGRAYAGAGLTPPVSVESSQ